MLPLHEAIPAAARSLDPGTFARWKRGLAREVARLARALHDRQRFHKDLYLCHFYVAEEETRRLPEWTGRVRLIDFHRLGHHRRARLWWRAKDLAQLFYSSRVEGVTARDRLRFWRAYHGGRRLARAARGLRWLVRLRAWRYGRHNGSG